MPADDLLVLTVANLRPEKGYDVLLDAVWMVADRNLPVRFAAVGRGPLVDELENAAPCARAGRAVPLPRRAF